MTKFTKINEDFRIEGVWWTPDKPDRKFSGVFEYAPKKSFLQLWRSFKEITEINKHDAPEIILGVSLDGEQLTLSKIYEASSTLGARGLRTKYGVINVFRGKHFHREEDIRFKDVTIRYSNFDNWLDISGIKIEPNF